MRAAVTFALIGAALAAAVVDLTPANFDKVVGGDDADVTLVKFFAPWCGHCKAMKQPYIKAAKELKKKNKRIRLAECNVDDHRALGERFEIQGFPTLKLFRGGDLSNPEEYQGGRDEKGIVEYMLQAAKPAVHEFDDEESMASWAKEQAGNVITGVFSAEDGSAFETFKNFANKARQSAVTGVVKAAKALGKISLIKPSEDPIHFDGEVSAEDLDKWLADNKFHLYGEISQSNFRDYQDRKLPIVWAFVDPSDEATRDKHDAAMRTAAAKFKGKMSFVWLDGTKYGGMAGRLGLQGKEWPSVAVDKAPKHFAFPTEGAAAEPEELEKFIAGVLDGSVEPTVKSAEPPASNPDDEGVWVLTGKALEAETVASGKDVFVEFYAPWCGHCKSLAPEYAKVAESVKDVSTLRVAKMDATENDVAVDGFDVQGFPTLYFVKADKEGGRGTIMKYEGGRTSSDILSYIKEHATFPVDA
eukprot:TRINITY_DN69314_c0_g1_i1.p2 TRINITY_DN69314_c0_g1~~TRINITY_DN69314_c0_g1_i1.p2  ORF type:complete len:472 (+),score=163.50 TRINITY_DN69314_c0_g1_i1:39-1454(+)